MAYYSAPWTPEPLLGGVGVSQTQVPTAILVYFGGCLHENRNVRDYQVFLA